MHHNLLKENVWEAVFLDASGTIFKPEFDAYGKVAIYPDALAILDCFRARMIANAHVKTGLITSWSKRVHEVLRDSGLSECFDVVVCADDVSRSKPFSEPFLLAAGTVQIDAARCLHIGDSLRDDIFGAHDAGMSGIWINRRGRTLLAEEQRMLRSLGHPWFSDMDEVHHYVETFFRDRMPT